MPTDSGISQSVALDLGRLWWLVDAPLFVDSDLITRLHEAYVWPELVEAEIEREEVKEVKQAVESALKGEAGADFKLPGFLASLAPTFSLKGNAEFSENSEDNLQSKNRIAGRRIESPERKLHELAREYLASYPERVLFADAPGGSYSNFRGSLEQSAVDEFLRSPPRPLVFLDIQPQSAVFPTMIEMEEGGFRPVFIDLEEKFLAGREPRPRYPRDSDPEADSKRADYWEALNETFSSRAAMEALESKTNDGRIGWADFRLLFKEDGATAHLHVVPAGKYHAGVFGYNFIHRSFRYGCRIVASLKSGNDMNVLAIYER